eukprot:CAMPEP_0172169468 /NCGR_PEP_ID=MMETSP1050-20130122/10718_1 /TAXON_ID=233186 /ORGANISM="Cryptomonas curvata, Strain CCAP979/52" /LENGTH=512 /DNA_ID=CAMNT_0012840521 /DNA_START=496 /DNA_END=2031 /DNA_ORIENTATION=+
MLCSGDFKTLPTWFTSEWQPSETDPNATTHCPSYNTYKGPSPAGTCTSRDDASCVSPGPDMAAGLLDITVLRLDAFEFTTPYHYTRQAVVRQPRKLPSVVDAFLNIFRCFSTTTWIVIGLEVLVAIVIFYIIEGPTNETLEDGWGSFPDTAYWVVSTAFGGADKRAETFAGRFVFAGHSFFCMIILATYTGSLGAYLSSSYTLPTLGRYDDLRSGAYTTAVVGPRWNSSDPDAALYKGEYLGGNGVAGSSAQFEHLQTVMSLDSAARFRMFTTQQLFTLDAKGAPFARGSIFDFGDGKNPCQTPSAVLGAFDLAACGYPEGLYGGQWADSLLVDEAVAVAELNGRRRRLLTCELQLLADKTPAVGLGLGFPASAAMGSGVADFFTLGIANLTATGVPAKLLARYGARQSDSLCVYSNSGGLQLDVTDTSGMFAICAVLCLSAAVHGAIERYVFFREKHDVMENNEIEREDACARIMNPADGAAVGGAGPMAMVDAEVVAADADDEARETLQE